jgi:hypothetical protein
MDDMMGRDMLPGDPFKGIRSLSSSGSGDALFGQMDDLMAKAMSGDGFPRGGSYSSKTMMYTAKRGSDGKMHSERFTSSTVGVPERNIRETQQAYSSSTSGTDKMALERQIGNQGRKQVKERSRLSGEERDTEMLRGMNEAQACQFDDRWRREAAPHLPSHRIHQSKCVPSGSPSLGQEARPFGRGGYPSRATEKSISSISSRMPIDSSEVPGQSSSKSHSRHALDSSQVGSLLRHEDVRSSQSGRHRSNNPFDY